ncbi:thiamine pyrophosphokinase [Ceratobasidium sp. AG-I]|nr:thiamine pyrophosphokinase [Ceratobasidium sp. AG-I]
MSTETQYWDTSFLTACERTPNPTALIVLNQPFATATFSRLWLKCGWRIFADGGSNCVYDAFDEEDRLRYLPHRIRGDLDSLRLDVRSWYEAQNVVVEHDKSQNSTDLMKCLDWVVEIEKENQLKLDVVILGGLSGRLDHTVHTMSLLHKLRTTRPRIFVVSSESVGWVLDQGHHQIDLDLRFVGPTCGLLPVGVASSVLTTTGLKWNLDNTPSSFNGLVSSSNAIVPLSREETRGLVTVTTSEPIWWCVEHIRTREDEKMEKEKVESE